MFRTTMFGILFIFTKIKEKNAFFFIRIQETKCFKHQNGEQKLAADGQKKPRKQAITAETEAQNALLKREDFKPSVLSTQTLAHQHTGDETQAKSMSKTACLR